MISKLGRYGVLAVVSMVSWVSGCASDIGAQDADIQGGVAETQQAFSANWDYLWASTGHTFANIGTSTNRTCFMSGLAGDLRPAGTTSQPGAGVRTNANGDYEIYVDSAGGALSTYARCVNTATGRTPEVTWHTGDPAQWLGPVTSARRCFLTSVATSNATELSPGFKSNSDNVRVFQDSTNWWLGGTQSGNAFARARCVDVSADLGGWLWVAGDPGARQDPLASNPGGATCLLTGVGGHFTDSSDFSDGAYVSYSATASQFYMNTKNGHSGWANCVQ